MESLRFGRWGRLAVVNRLREERLGNARLGGAGPLASAMRRCGTFSKAWAWSDKFCEWNRLAGVVLFRYGGGHFCATLFSESPHRMNAQQNLCFAPPLPTQTNRSSSWPKFASCKSGNSFC